MLVANSVHHENIINILPELRYLLVPQVDQFHLGDPESKIHLIQTVGLLFGGKPNA